MRNVNSVWTVGALTAVALASLAEAGGTGWEKFEFKDSQFSVSFPSKPKVDTSKPSIETIVKAVRVAANSGSLEYSVGCLTYAPQVAEKFNKIDPVEFAVNQKDGTVKRTKGKVLTQKDVAVGKEKRPGYELVIQLPKGFIRQRVVYAHGCLYQLMIIGTTLEMVNGPDAERFVGSFLFTK